MPRGKKEAGSSKKQLRHMIRIRITFEKTEAMRYTSHLDLQRTWERTFRRARLPLAYSQGFNPRPKINLATALPLGLTGENELADVWLDQDLPVDEIEDKLRKVSPPGINVKYVQSIDLQEPKLPNLVHSSVYELTMLVPIPDLQQRISDLQEKKVILRERRGKKYDLKPLIHDIGEIRITSAGEEQFSLHLASLTGATGRPDEVLDQLNISFADVRICRKQIILKSKSK
jgi:radical SAM-linked protein